MPDLTLDTLMDEGGYGDRAKLENLVVLEELDRKKKARNMAVPTDDARVRARLREIGEPITLFGERPADRRERLIYVLSQINVARGEGLQQESESDESESDEEKEEEFYTPGTIELLEARRRIAEYSLPRAQKRIAQQRLESKVPLQQLNDIRKRVFNEVKRFANLGSQIGDERPISMVRFSPNSQILATGSWSGSIKFWNIPACTPLRTLRGHGDKVGGLAWHPQATLTQSEDTVNLVSGAGDSDVSLWSLNSDAPLATLKGHEGRVCRTAFHPSGAYVASASFDTSWRLWDVSTQKELLLQEGHSKEVYAVEFQDDGSLLASGGLDAIGRVWDLRTGRTALVLDGHTQGIYSIAFSPTGYQLVTGAGDDTIRVWDMRASNAVYTIPAHRSNVADVRFFRSSQLSPYATVSKESLDVEMEDPDVSGDKLKTNNTNKNLEESYRCGLYYASAGYDGLVKIWSADDWQLVKTLTTDAGKVMSVDLSEDARYLVSGTYNRNYQLYEPEPEVTV